MDWHDESCRKADIVFFGDGRSCLSCGAVAPGCSSALLPPIRQLADIRILSLKFGHSSDPIVCDVFTQDLSSYPEYEAISYTWADESGDATKSRSIHVSGKSFPVTANCENALRRARRRFTDRNIWIDAVCIDQDNVEERGHQVGLMPRIYAGAKHVLIYVGEAADQSTAALASVADGPIQWTPFLKLMSRRYFTRAWTLQEVALARKATLLCGQDSAPWALLTQSLLENAPNPFDTANGEDRERGGHGERSGLRIINNEDILLKLPPQLSFDYTMYSSPGQVLTLLDLGRRSQASDPRDKVFSLLGLMPGGRMGHIEADYSMDTCQLYTKVAEYVASQHDWLAVLARAGTRNSSTTSLPSWAPDWSQELYTAPVELSKLSFHPYINGACDTDGRTLALKILRHGYKHNDVRRHATYLETDLNIHWDSYVAQRTKTHLWQGYPEQTTPFLDFFCHLLDTTKLAVAEDTYPPIISHNIGYLDMEMRPLPESVNSGCEEYRLVSILHTFGTRSVCGIPIETAVQIYTLTIAEMIHLDIFTELGLTLSTSNGLSDHAVGEEEDASVNRYLEAVLSDTRAVSASGVPMDPSLGNLWITKYNAGKLAGVESRNLSSLRIISCLGTRNKGEPTYTTTNVTPAEMEKGIWSVHHPSFAEANEALWKLLLYQYLYREALVTIR